MSDFQLKQQEGGDELIAALSRFQDNPKVVEESPEVMGTWQWS